MSRVYRWVIVFVCFGWLFGIVPAAVYLRNWDPPTSHLAPPDALLIYVMLPAELVLAAVALFLVCAPLFSLIEWAMGPGEEKQSSSSPQELYATGQIDMARLEELITIQEKN